MWVEITYLFPNFNGVTIEVWEWISNLIPYCIMDAIIYPLTGIWWEWLDVNVNENCFDTVSMHGYMPGVILVWWWIYRLYHGLLKSTHWSLEDVVVVSKLYSFNTCHVFSLWALNVPCILSHQYQFAHVYKVINAGIKVKHVNKRGPRCWDNFFKIYDDISEIHITLWVVRFDSRLSEASMCQYTRISLVLIMDWDLFRTMLLSEPMLTCC